MEGVGAYGQAPRFSQIHATLGVVSAAGQMKLSSLAIDGTGGS